MKILVILFAFILISGCAATEVNRVFSADGITHVTLRTGRAMQAEVHRLNTKNITVNGVPTGGARGYHSSDPDGKEISANDWGLDFVGKRYGENLIISSKNEIQYIHHNYVFDHVVLTLPEGITFTLFPRILNGDGAPDVSNP